MTQGVGKGFAPSVGAANKAVGGIVKQEIHPDGVEGTNFSLQKMGDAIREGRNDPRIRGWAGMCVTRKEAEGLAHRVSWDSWVESDRLPNSGYVVRAKTKSRELATASGKTLQEAWQELCARLRGLSGVSPETGKLKSNKEFAQAILDEVRRTTQYCQDPVGTEMVVKPHVTLCLDDHGLCMPAGDCDDRCVAFASGVMSLGIEARCVAQAYNTPQATHVICAIYDPDNGGWLKVDPSHEKWPVGQSHPSTKEWWLDPLSGSISTETGTKMTLGKEPDHGDFIGVGAIPFAHAFSPLAHGASYVPVGLESGYPCQPDGTECGTEGRVITEPSSAPSTQPHEEPASPAATVPLKVPPAEPVVSSFKGLGLFPDDDGDKVFRR